MIYNYTIERNERKEIKRDPLKKLAVLLLLVLVGVTAWGQVKTTVKGSSSVAKPTTLEVWGVNDAW